MSSEKPDQIQASVAAALSRLRGDLGPSGATAPRMEELQAPERAKPANDVRGDPFFRSLQSSPPESGAASGLRAPIPMTPFPRMQASQEATSTSTQAAEEQAPAPPEEPAARIEMPEMPERTSGLGPAAMPEPLAASAPAPAAPAAPQAPSATAAGQAQAPGGTSPLSRVMRGTAASTGEPAQRDLLAGLPPPPISEPIAADTGADAQRRRRRNRRLAAAAAAVLILAVGVWLWSGREPDTEVPVIAAESTPEKVKPADEGGLQVQNQDVQVLDPTAQAQGETVLPEPEQPITPSAAAPAAEETPTVVEGPAPEASPTVMSEGPASETQLAPEVPLSATPLPALEENGAAAETASSQPGGTAPSEPAATAAQPEQAAAAPATAEPAPAESAAEAAPAASPTHAPPAAAAQPQETTPSPAPQPATTQEAAVTPAAPTAGTGSTRIQLAAGKSEASVQKEWAALQKAHPDLLGNLSLTIERVDKGAAGIFYRLQAGPLADKAAARALCASLKAKGRDCIVVAK